MCAQILKWLRWPSCFPLTRFLPFFTCDTFWCPPPKFTLISFSHLLWFFGRLTHKDLFINGPPPPISDFCLFRSVRNTGRSSKRGKYWVFFALVPSRWGHIRLATLLDWNSLFLTGSLLSLAPGNYSFSFPFTPPGRKCHQILPALSYYIVPGVSSYLAHILTCSPFLELTLTYPFWMYGLFPASILADMLEEW